MSPTKKVETACKLALEDMRGGYIMSDKRTQLNILFGCDTSAADAYISDDDPFLRKREVTPILAQLAFNVLGIYDATPMLLLEPPAGP
jgi:hypothetical protein